MELDQLLEVLERQIRERFEADSVAQLAVLVVARRLESFCLFLFFVFELKRQSRRHSSQITRE